MRQLATLGRGSRRWFAAAAAAGTGTVAAGIGLLATAAYLIVRADLQPPILELTVAIVGVRFFGIARAGLRYLERLAGHDAALRLVAALRVRSFAALERIAPTGLESEETGRALTGLTDDLDRIEQGIVRSVIPGLTTVIVVVGAALTAWLLAPPLGPAIASGLTITALAAGGATLATGRRSDRQHAAARAELTAAIVDTLEGRSEAFVYGRAGDLLERVATADARLTRLANRASWSAAVGGSMVALGTGLTLWLVVRVGVEASTAGALDPLLLGALAMFTLAAFEPVAALPAGLARLDGALEATARFDSLEARPESVQLPDQPGEIGTASLRLEGAGVYRRGSWHLRGVDLELRPGRRIAVVGASGAGKSTLIDLLMRFRELDEGRYTVGGRAAPTLDPAAIRGLIALAAEDAPLLDATLAENLTLGLSIPQPDLDEACRALGLGPLLDRLPEGFATRVGPRGSFVSGGERRRITLARALAAGRPLLVLDEPTAGLEPTLATEVLDTMLDTAAARGVLLITHDAIGLAAMDEILVLSEGRVIERGTHDELMARAGAYRRLRTSGAER